jgi:LmbE family N-acetylglucosaminyl deacetylase
MSHAYAEFVRNYSSLLDRARSLPLGGLAPAVQPPVALGAPTVLVFSPHPDDECITGALPLRLRRELAWRVAVVAVTQGSKVERQSARLQELRGALGFLSFDLVTTRDGGLTGINLAGRASDQAAWAEAVAVLAAIIRDRKPRVIFMPHESDANPTHIGTHYAVVDALERIGEGFTGLVVESEFWGAMADPNLMIQSSPDDVADLVAALTFHVGEVERNPYHVLLPAWMSDNVRRGGELVGGFGGPVPNYNFATLYRLRRWNGHALEPVLASGTCVPVDGDLVAVLNI